MLLRYNYKQLVNDRIVCNDNKHSLKVGKSLNGI